MIIQIVGSLTFSPALGNFITQLDSAISVPIKQISDIQNNVSSLSSFSTFNSSEVRGSVTASLQRAERALRDYDKVPLCNNIIFHSSPHF
jgi:hypothetical protein